MTVLDSKALTKIQTIALVTIVVVAAVGGGVAYVLWSGQSQPQDFIRIGVCADLDMPQGKDAWQGAVLAAERLNSQGGVLGRNITIVAEDDDSDSGPDIAIASNAMIKLITVDRADYIISGGQFLTAYQDICAENKKILLSVFGTRDNYAQRVLDEYDKYKYSFRTSPCNQTTANLGIIGEILTLGNYTGFTKVALLFQDFGASSRQLVVNITSSISEYGMEVVYSGFVPMTTTDFTSYFAAIEDSGAQILFPIIITQAVRPLVIEWYDRQSPFVLWGVMWLAAESNFWALTEGKCDTVTFAGQPAVAGYPMTSATLPARDAYVQRWGEVPTDVAVAAYDALRFILSDAIERAGTTEAEAVIRTLETVNVETTSARHFVFTSSHDVMVGAINDPTSGYSVMCNFQWQNGNQVPVKPESIMKEAGATYKYPPWQGPWSK